MGNDFGLRNIIIGSIYDAATTSPKNALGAKAEMHDGKVFRYCKTTTDITMGNLVNTLYNAAAGVQCAIAATYFGVDASTAPAADEGGSIGDKTIRICVLSGTTAITANQYADGHLFITDGTGQGEFYQIEKNEANAATGDSTVTIRDGLRIALDNSSVGLLQVSPFHVAAHTQANYGGDLNQVVVGRAMVASTAGTDSSTEYIWVQTRGVSMLLSGAATLVAGDQVYAGEDVDGVVQTAVAGEEQIQSFGVCTADTADTIYAPVILMGPTG